MAAMTADRLAEIEHRAWAARGISDTPLLDDNDCDWLIAEIKRLRIREEVAKAVIEGSEKEILRLRRQLGILIEDECDADD